MEVCLVGKGNLTQRSVAGILEAKGAVGKSLGAHRSLFRRRASRFGTEQVIPWRWHPTSYYGL